MAYNLYSINLVANVPVDLFTATNPGKIIRVYSTDNAAILTFTIGTLTEKTIYFGWNEENLRRLNFNTGEVVRVMSDVATSIRVEIIDEISLIFV